MTSRGWLLLAGAGALVVLVAVSRSWLVASAGDAVLGTVQVSVTGSQASPLVPAAALLAGAALVAGLVGSRPVRVTAGVALLTAGLLAGVATAGVLLDPAAAAQAALTERTGVAGAVTGVGVVASVAVSGWPWSALTGALCLAGAGVVRLLTAGAGAAGRTEQGTAAETAADRRERHERGDWDRLSAGEDPTEAEQD